jgi:hypothetical protein
MSVNLAGQSKRLVTFAPLPKETDLDVPMKNFLMTRPPICLLAPLLIALATIAQADPGLNATAEQELKAAGVDKYLGEFTPTSSEDVGDGWTRHTFDPQYVLDGSYPLGVRPEGPVCIAGTDYSVFTREGDPKKLLVFLQGGGACWQDFYACNILSEAQEPGEAAQFAGRFGVFDDTQAENPFADHSVVYMPYCDGSVFGGDNDVNDGNFPFGPTRHHRGLRNVSAGMDVASATFPNAKQITVMGHSAGGVGVASFTPFLARFNFGSNAKLTVFNDAGPIAVNLGTSPAEGGPDIPWLSVFARKLDWQFDKFYPASCVADGRCNAFGQQTGIIDWRLENDRTIREAFYETDSDATNRFFAQGDGSLMDPEVYRELILTEHGALNEAYPRRYKRFIVSNDDTHGGVQGTADSPCSPLPQPFLFYTQEANGELLTDWTAEFIRIGDRQSQFGWKDVVEDYVPADCAP